MGSNMIVKSVPCEITDSRNTFSNTYITLKAWG